MNSRRKFLVQGATVAGLAAAGSFQLSCSSVPAAKRFNAASSPAMRIKAAVRRDETILRLGGHGDNWHMSWAADDRQYMSMCDGTGWWTEQPTNFYNSRVLAIEGSPHDATFHDVATYPQILQPRAGKPFYHPFGTLALDGNIYQFLSSIFRGIKLIYSDDNGRTWRNQDGSTPVIWESKEQQSHERMLFFEEPQHALPFISVLQMGRNYAANQDGYVYLYAPNGISEGTMNELVMMRVHKSRIRDRAGYEFFSGTRPDGRATWTADVDARRPVHTFPDGWVNTLLHPMAWIPSLAYNEALGLYMMLNWAPGSAPDGYWFEKPSYLGLWVADQPWGPWVQVHEETSWLPGGDTAARAYSPVFAPKWIAPDGKSFWLVWTDFQSSIGLRDAWLAEIKRFSSSPDEHRKWGKRQHELQPYYGFNTQRVDLIVA